MDGTSSTDTYEVEYAVIDMASQHAPEAPNASSHDASSIHLTPYAGEDQLPIIASLIERELSEPYIVYTYRYFLRGWPQHTFLAWATLDAESDASSVSACDSVSSSRSRSSSDSSSLSEHESDAGLPARCLPIGVIVSKLEQHRGRHQRGYIAMLSVAPEWRGRGVGGYTPTKLVQRGVAALAEEGAHEIVLETEADNAASLALYESFGFIREKRLYRFYLNGKDCFRLVLPIANPTSGFSIASVMQPQSPPCGISTMQSGIA